MTGSTGGCASYRPAREQDRARADRAAPRPEPRSTARSTELAELVKAHRPQLLAEKGCGALTAAILIGHTAGVKHSAKRTASGCRPGPRRSLLLGAAHPAPAQPRRGPPAQPRAAHHRDHPRPTRPRHQGSTSRAKKPKARPPRARCAASSATSPAASTTYSPNRPPTSHKPLTASRSPSPSHQQSPNVPTHSERSCRSTQRPTRWSASTRADQSRAVLRPAPSHGERSPLTSHTTNRRDTRRYHALTNGDQRVLRPSAALDEPPRDRQHPNPNRSQPLASHPSRLTSKPTRNTQIATRRLT